MSDRSSCRGLGRRLPLRGKTLGAIVLAGASVMSLVPAASGASITWAGISTSFTWDLATSPNFIDPTGTPAVFNAGDSPFFLDGAFGTVSLVGSLNPASVTVDAIQDYNFIGATGSRSLRSQLNNLPDRQ